MKLHINIYTIFAVFVALIFTGCDKRFGMNRPTELSIDIHIPQLNGPICAEHLLTALSPMDGINSVVPNVEEKSILVTYNPSGLARKNIEYFIATLGYDANELTGDPKEKAKLNELCR